jgi:hypothetical protein
MGTSLRLQRKMQSTLSQWLPDTRATRRRALAQMITELHSAEHVHLLRGPAGLRELPYLKARRATGDGFLEMRMSIPNDFTVVLQYSPVRDCLIDRAVQGTQTEGTGPIRILVDPAEAVRDLRETTFRASSDLYRWFVGKGR